LSGSEKASQKVHVGLGKKREYMSRPILIIGIGSEYRSDDGVGLVVARELQAKKLPHILVI